MNLKETLEIAIRNGRDLASNIATSQFGDESPEARTITRRWSVTDTAQLIGVSRQAIIKAEDEGRLPPPDMYEDARGRPRRKGYTIYQIDNMRDVFNARPGRDQETDDPSVVAIANQKGGSLKTSSSVHFAQNSAMSGYRVLLVDMDPQATASLYFGYVADINTFEADTAVPFLLGERGDLSYCVQTTCWPGLDIIPSCLGMQRLETELLQRADNGELEHPPHLMLRAGLESIFDDYDIVIIDSSPNLGQGTINIMCAADVIITPTPAEMNDYLSTTQFFEALKDLMAGIDLGSFEPDLRVLITKYSHQAGSASQLMAKAIRNSWGDMVLENMVSTTEEVGKGQVRMRTIYEQSSDQRSTTSAWNKAVRIWNPVFEEIISDVIEPLWPSKQEGLK